MSLPFIPTAFERTAKWMRRGGRESDIALSSRVRLARNLKRYEFPHHASPQELLTVRHRTFQALEFNKGTPALGDIKLLPFEEFTGWERQSLIDRYLTSREHVGEELARGLAATPDASLSILINEEDHLRLQSLLPGLQLVPAFDLVDHVDDSLESYFDAHGGLAYSEEFGYLTACPTNAGTGMRASVMLHLPALEISEKIERARKWAEGKGLTLRGTFGEGSKVWGHLHQLSNQVTLGLDEAEILMDVENAAQEICTMERQARAALPTRHSIEARDRIGRAYGALRYAQRMGCREATECLSLLRLAHELNWAKGLNRQRFNELMVWIRPAYLQVMHGRAISGAERDTLRCELLGPHIAKIKLEATFSTAPNAKRGRPQTPDATPETASNDDASPPQDEDK